MLLSQKTVDRFYIIALAVITILLCVLIFTVFPSKYKKTEGKLEIPIPKDEGMQPTEVVDPILREIRVSLDWDDSAGKTKFRVGSTSVESFGKLEEILQGEVCRLKKEGRQTNASPIISIYDGELPEHYNIVPVVINAAPNIPWQDVVNVINICKKLDIGIVFANRYTSPDERDDSPLPWCR